jgi:hypothetical protein
MSMVSWFRDVCHIELFRPKGEEHPFEAIAALLAASADFGGDETRFSARFSDGQMHPVVPDEAWLRGFVAAVEDPFAREVAPGFGLATAGPDPLMFSFRRDVAYGRRITSTARVAIPAWWPAARLAEYTHVLATAYESPVTRVLPFALEEVLAWATGVAPEVPALGLSAGELEPFTKLLPRLAIDRSELPVCVAWINVWSADVVDRIGRDRILAQPWHLQAPADRGGLLLVSTEAPPTHEHPDAIRAIGRLVAGLELGAVQAAATRTG